MEARVKAIRAKSEAVPTITTEIAVQKLPRTVTGTYYWESNKEKVVPVKLNIDVMKVTAGQLIQFQGTHYY